MSTEEWEPGMDTTSDREAQAGESLTAHHMQNGQDTSADGAAEQLVVERRSSNGPEHGTPGDTSPPSSADSATDTEAGGRERREPVILSPPNGATISSERVTLSGTSEPSGRIVLRDWLVPVAWSTADETGRWTTTVMELDGGTHIFVAEWVDDDGKLLATSPGCTIEVTAQPADAEREGAAEERGGFLGLGRLFRRCRTSQRTEESSQPHETHVEPARPAPEIRTDAGASPVWVAPSPAAKPEPAEVRPAEARREEARDVLAPASSRPPAAPDVSTNEERTPEGTAEAGPADVQRAAPPEVAAPAILHPATGSQVGGAVTLYGTFTPGGAIEIVDESTVVGRAESDDTGYWVAMVEALVPGTHQLYARSFAEGSAQHLISAPVEVIVHDA